MTLAEYIDFYFWGNKADFARSQNVKPPQVSQWLKKDNYFVHDHELMLKRRTLSSVRVRRK